MHRAGQLSSVLAVAPTRLYRCKLCQDSTCGGCSTTTFQVSARSRRRDTAAARWRFAVVQGEVDLPCFCLGRAAARSTTARRRWTRSSERMRFASVQAPGAAPSLRRASPCAWMAAGAPGLRAARPRSALEQIVSGTMSCWDKLQVAMPAIPHAARKIEASARAPGPHLAATWKAHRLRAARRAFRRRNLRAVSVALAGLPDLQRLFISAHGELHDESLRG